MIACAMIHLKINGKSYTVNENPDIPLLKVLREYLGLTATKCGCGIGKCGSCTIKIDQEAYRSCQLSIGHINGKKITTIEGLPEDHPVKKAWILEQVEECSHCNSGHIMQAVALLSKIINPSKEDIMHSIGSDLCNCGSNPRLINAIIRASKECYDS